jgi:hypothetical protein
MTSVLRGNHLGDLYRYFTSRHSAANLSARFWVAAKNCPAPLLPSYLALDLLRICGHYVRISRAKESSHP